MSETIINTPEFSVSELAGAVKRTLETSFGRVRVRGEITEFKAYASGHQYFALKDETAKIRGIIWKGVVPRVGLKAENGLEVIATGRLTSYPERSEYQLIIEKLEYAGAGALLARIEALRVKLQAEGLFSTQRPLPLLPRIIGVITSAQGAVLQDIKTTIARRFPRPILLWPVPVQGDGAAEKIAAAINGFNNLPADFPQPDILIVARGGGSLEDLMAFNEEIVVRAAASSRIPLISAVGHETDTTLIDHASDRRAPTPTAAAEIAVPARLELLADLTQRAARLEGALARHTHMAATSLERAVAKLPDLPTMLNIARQRLDDRGERHSLALPNLMASKRARLERLLLRHPREILANLKGRTDLLAHRLVMALPNRLRLAQKSLDSAAYKIPTPDHEIRQRHAALNILAQKLHSNLLLRQQDAAYRLGALATRLDAVSYQNVLARGFALVTSAQSTPVTTASAIKPGMALRLHFADGEAAAKATGTARSSQLDLGL